MSKPRHVMSIDTRLDRSLFPEKTLFFFDFDGVLIDQSEEKLYRLEETEGERTRLDQLAHEIGIEPSLYGTQYLRHMVFQALHTSPSKSTAITEFAFELDDPYFILTARSSPYAVRRMFRFLESHRLNPQEVFCLGRSSKGEHLRHMLKAFPEHHIVFFDDTPIHIETALALGDPRLTVIQVVSDPCIEEAEYFRYHMLNSRRQINWSVSVIESLQQQAKELGPDWWRVQYLQEFPPEPVEYDSRGNIKERKQ